MLEQGFYAAEADGLRAHSSVRSVVCTNRIADVVRMPYDGLLSYFYSHSALTAAIARVRGKRVVVTGGGEQVFRGSMSTAVNYWMRLTAFQWTALSANRVLATSTADYNRMRQLAFFGDGNIDLSYHGAPAADRFTPANFGNERPRGSLVTICGMDTEQNVRRKGAYEAVALLKQIAGIYPDASLTIIGRDTCKALVEERARQLGEQGRVRFTGYVTEEQKLHLLRESRFYVQLSEYEGFGIGALEALAQGCHVIHSGVGGLLDTINGFGTTLRRDQIEQFDPRTFAEYRPNLSRLRDHLEQFLVIHRADAIVSALKAAHPRK
jgi:glycosyltransferase involved in cell wall biosynthesis